MSEGTGIISINGRSVDQYFAEERDRNAVLAPLLMADMRSKLDLLINVKGGGTTGQGGAIRQGIARAIKEMFGLASGNDPTPADADGQPTEEAPGEGSLAKRLRDSGFLTRDGRMKERKHYGRKGARRGYQFSKR